MKYRIVKNVYRVSVARRLCHKGILEIGDEKKINLFQSPAGSAIKESTTQMTFQEVEFVSVARRLCHKGITVGLTTNPQYLVSVARRLCHKGILTLKDLSYNFKGFSRPQALP